MGHSAALVHAHSSMEMQRPVKQLASISATLPSGQAGSTRRQVTLERSQFAPASHAPRCAMGWVVQERLSVKVVPSQPQRASGSVQAMSEKTQCQVSPQAGPPMQMAPPAQGEDALHVEAPPASTPASTLESARPASTLPESAALASMTLASTPASQRRYVSATGPAQVQ
jgi:hypothetical protein